MTTGSDAGERPRDDDVERDAHLRAALRHAPDADLQPPAALSAAILREAQAAVATPRAAPPAATTPKRSGGWMALFASSFGGGMPWATGIAGVLVAAVALSLWWGEPVPPPRGDRAALREEAPRTAAVDPSRPSAAVGTGASAAEFPPPTAVEPAASTATVDATAADVRRRVGPASGGQAGGAAHDATSPRKTGAPADAASNAMRWQMARPPGAATAPAPPVTQGGASRAAGNGRADGSLRAPDPVPPPDAIIERADRATPPVAQATQSSPAATAPAPAAAPSPLAKAQADAPAARMQAQPPGAPESDTASADRSSAAAQPATEAPPGAWSAPRHAANRQPPLPDPRTARLQRDGETEPRPVDDAAAGWLQRLAALSRQRWKPAEPPPEAGVAGGTVRWFDASGRLLATASLRDDGVAWRDERAAASWLLPLTAEELAGLGRP